MSERPISDVINISMSRLSTTVTRQGFGAALILANFDTTLTRVSTVSKASYATTLSALGLDSSSAAYAAFTDYFAQEPSPNTGYLGRVQSTRQDITILTYDGATTYKITVVTAAGSTSYTSTGAGSAPLTAADLATKVNAHADVSAADSGSDVQVTLAGTTDVYIYGEVTGGTGTIDATPSAGTVEDLDDALTACKAESSNWYGIVGSGTEGRTLAQQKLVADWAESNDRLYIVASADDNCRDTTVGADTSTSIAGYCRAQAMKNTAVIFHGSAATEYLDAALFGSCLPKTVGSVNWNWRTLSSVTVDTSHTPTRRTNMGAKGCSWYESVAGTNVTQVGIGQAQNGYGDFIDITRLSHYLKFRVAENLIALLAAQDQVPMDEQGQAAVKAEVQDVCEELQDAGGIQSYTITVPNPQDLAESYRQKRTWPLCNFTAQSRAKANSFTIAGVVTT